MGVSCQNLGITAYTIKNYSNPKSKFEKNEGNAYTACKDKQKLVKINKSNRNKLVWGTFLAHLMFPCNSKDIAGCWGKYITYTWKKKESLLKVNLLKHHLKKFFFTGDWIFIEHVLRGKSGSINNWTKNSKSFGEDLKKQMKENKFGSSFPVLLLTKF